MKNRKLTPELLDHLPADDPSAIRSRADLRRINYFMGNYSWITKSIPKNTTSISEFGSGDGHLINRLAKKFPNAQLLAYDLAPQPKDLHPEVQWKQGDVLNSELNHQGGVLIANLILHHFTEDELRKIAPWIRSFDTIIINEPLRWPTLITMGKLASPIINDVTRHDMRVSIEAGFKLGELAPILGLAEDGFQIQDNCNWRGSYRVLAYRK